MGSDVSHFNVVKKARNQRERKQLVFINKALIMPVARRYHYQIAICTPDYVGARLRKNLKWRDQRQAAKLSQLRDILCLPAPKTQVVRSKINRNFGKRLSLLVPHFAKAH